MSELRNYLSEEAIPSIEELLTENIEQAEKIQQLLSEKSEMQQIMQGQQLTLQELQEKIVTLNNSDLQLKEADLKLKQSMENLIEAEKLKKRMTEDAKRSQEQYEKAVRTATIKEREAIKREHEARYIVENQDKVLSEKADKMTSNTRQSLYKKYQEKEKRLLTAYKSKEMGLHVLTLGGLLYGIYVTVLTVFLTNRFLADSKAFVEEIWHISMWIWENVLKLANKAFQACMDIPNEIVANILGWLVQILIVIIIMGIILAGSIWGLHNLYQLYKERFADMTSLVVMLVSFSLLVWFGDYIGNYVKWNLIIVFLLIQSGYIGIRMYAEKQ